MRFGIVAANLLDEALGVLAPDERLDCIAQLMVRRRANIDDRVDDHSRTLVLDARADGPADLAGKCGMFQSGRARWGVRLRLFPNPRSAPRPPLPLPPRSALIQVADYLQAPGVRWDGLSRHEPRET